MDEFKKAVEQVGEAFKPEPTPKWVSNVGWAISLAFIAVVAVSIGWKMLGWAGIV